MGVLPGLGSADLGLERRAEQRQMAEAIDPPQPRFNGQQRARDPTLLLVRRAPVVDLVGDLAELGIERFQAVRGLQTDAQGLEETQLVQRERVLEPFIQTGRLQLAPPGGLLGLGQVGDHVFQKDGTPSCSRRS